MDCIYLFACFFSSLLASLSHWCNLLMSFTTHSRHEKSCLAHSSNTARANLLVVLILSACLNFLNLAFKYFSLFSALAILASALRKRLFNARIFAIATLFFMFTCREARCASAGSDWVPVLFCAIPDLLTLCFAPSNFLLLDLLSLFCSQQLHLCINTPLILFDHIQGNHGCYSPWSVFCADCNRCRCCFPDCRDSGGEKHTGFSVSGSWTR